MFLPISPFLNLHVVPIFPRTKKGRTWKSHPKKRPPGCENPHPEICYLPLLPVMWTTRSLWPEAKKNISWAARHFQKMGQHMSVSPKVVTHTVRFSCFLATYSSLFQILRILNPNGPGRPPFGLFIWSRINSLTWNNWKVEEFLPCHLTTKNSGSPNSLIFFGWFHVVSQFPTFLSHDLRPKGGWTKAKPGKMMGLYGILICWIQIA